jgi:hypothetical protein
MEKISREVCSSELYRFDEEEGRDRLKPVLHSEVEGLPEEPQEPLAQRAAALRRRRRRGF